MLTVTLTNTGDETVQLTPHKRTFYSGDYHMGKVCINGNLWNHALKTRAGTYGWELPVRNLSPGETKEEKFIILHNDIDRKFAFNKAGNYNVRIQYNRGSEKLYSNTLQIEVSDPESDLDQSILEILKTKEYQRSYGRLLQIPHASAPPKMYSEEKRRSFEEAGQAIQNELSDPSYTWYLFFSEDKRKLFEKLVTEHPDSTYAPYITFSLGRHYANLADRRENSSSTYYEKSKSYFHKTIDLVDNAMLTKWSKFELKN